jgi:two-component system response regulator AgrA
MRETIFGGAFMLSVFLYGKSRSLEVAYKAVHSYIKAQKYDMEIIITTNDPGKIIKYIAKNKSNGLYILELQPGEWDSSEAQGLEAARLIRKHDPRGFIVFLASSPDFLPLTFEYKLEALAYIQKSDEIAMSRQICECIDDSYQKHVSRAQGGNYIFKEQGGGRISCALDDILFFETESPNTKLIILHAKKRCYKFYGTINEIVKELPVGLFFRCHKSFIVNVGNLTEEQIAEIRLGRDNIAMPDGAICCISARRKSGLTKLLDS